MQRICANNWCRQSFEITADDFAFYEKVSPIFGGKKYRIPPPTLCPPCRQQRRLTFRNERRLHKRQSNLTGREIISIYPSDTPFPVCEPEMWYSDQWDAMSYGTAYDVHHTLFDQYRALQHRVPRIGLVSVHNENCPYVQQVWYSKNCYYCIDAGFTEDAYYCSATYHSRNLADCASVRSGELSFNLVDCTQCYRSASLIDCKNCSDAFFSIDCSQCQRIAFCWNLRGKQCHIFNRPVGEDEWKRTLARVLSGSHRQWQEHSVTFSSLLPKAIRRANHNLHCEECVGDYLLHSRTCHTCFDIDQCQDLKYCCRMDERVTTAMDLDHASLAELAYEGTSIAGHRIIFCILSYSPSNSDLLYCDTLTECSHCFGCIGLKRKQYCILNKQYTKEEYEALVPKIIENMKANGEWGEFFSVSMSPFAYNETVAQEYFPLTKEEVLARGWQWRDEVDEAPKVDKIIPAERLPDSIDDIPDDILNWAIKCEVTGRPFRIVKQELQFYRKMRLPIPRFHPDERHRRRMAMRNPRKLWKRNCMKCGKEIETTYGPERPETVYCETCYLAAVY